MAIAPTYIDGNDADPDQRALFRRDFEQETWFAKRFRRGTHRLHFDARVYAFRDIITRRLVESGIIATPVALEELHAHIPREKQVADKSGQVPAAIAMYEPGDEFLSTYGRFVKDFIAPAAMDEPFYYQAVPTVRISYPGSPGFTWRPNYHTDVALGHPPQGVNLWMPLTRCLDGNSLIYAELDDSMAIWREFAFDFSAFHRQLDVDDALQERCKRLCRPLRCGYGDVLMFDSRCMHLSQRNSTDQTRVSIDIRLLRVSDYAVTKQRYAGTGRRKLPFEPSAYYAPTPCDV